MKLAFVINVFREGNFHSGGERLFYELVSRAVADGFTVDLYCTTYLSNINILKTKLNKITFLGHPKDFKYPEKIETFYNNVKERTQAEDYDYVISENISPPLDIGVLQGHSLLHYKKKSGFLYGLLKRKHINSQKKWLKNQYRKVIVPSNVLKDELKENFNIPEEKFVVMYPGVDVPETSNTKDLSGIFTFGLSAPSFEKKGGYVLLRALKELKDKNHIFRAKIIYPKYKKNIKLQFLLSLYGLRDFVEFLPYQADMQSFYNSINCVVMPSFLETFGLVALEGMASGVPAIVSSYCGAKEIIKDGENGFVFDKNLAEKMETLLSNRVNYEKLSENAVKTASNQNWAGFYQRFIEYLRGL